MTEQLSPLLKGVSVMEGSPPRVTKEPPAIGHNSEVRTVEEPYVQQGPSWF